MDIRERKNKETGEIVEIFDCDNVMVFSYVGETCRKCEIYSEMS
jgi:hypothetical protein